MYHTMFQLTLFDLEAKNLYFQRCYYANSKCAHLCFKRENCVGLMFLMMDNYLVLKGGKLTLTLSSLIIPTCKLKVGFNIETMQCRSYFFMPCHLKAYFEKNSNIKIIGRHWSRQFGWIFPSARDLEVRFQCKCVLVPLYTSMYMKLEENRDSLIQSKDVILKHTNHHQVITMDSKQITITKQDNQNINILNLGQKIERVFPPSWFIQGNKLFFIQSKLQPSYRLSLHETAEILLLTAPKQSAVWQLLSSLKITCQPNNVTLYIVQPSEYINLGKQINLIWTQDYFFTLQFMQRKSLIGKQVCSYVKLLMAY